jgi:mannose-1-phosphate guanylyltransferase / phosphomannomutase
MHAAIVAGGRGTRASRLTGDLIPKALLPVAGIPIIIRQMRVLRREGVTHVSVLGGHLGEQLEQVLIPEAATLGLSLKVIVEPTPLGTAGCLSALDRSTHDWLIVYGDMLFDIALQPLFDFHRRQQAVLTVVAHPNDHPRTSDLIVEDNGFARAILPAKQVRHHDYRNLVPAGLYLASPAFFSQINRNEKADMIHDVLPGIVASGNRLAVYNTPEYLRDVGTTGRHESAERDLALGRPETMNGHNYRPAVFFDCDGVLNHEPGQHGAIAEDDVKLLFGAGAAVRHARDAGLLTVAVTNRSQVAKGFVTFERLSHILGHLEALLAEDGGVLDRIYFCPHHPEPGFPGEVPQLKVRCECRKPGTLLLRRAFAELPIDRQRSALIGDSLRDIGAARGAGIWAYGVRTGHGCRDREPYEREFGIPPTPDLMFETVSEAVDFQILYREQVASTVDAICERVKERGTPLLVGVCGRSRTGKTTAAHAMARVLTEQQVSCLHVRLDNWIVPAGDRKPHSSAETRNRVDAMPNLVRALRAGKCVHAPGYDEATRAASHAFTYGAADKSVIILDGVFAGHPSIREMLDFVAFTTVPLQLMQTRFRSFYHWKGFEGDAIETLWQERSADEWSAVDAQRRSADFIITLGTDGP